SELIVALAWRRAEVAGKLLGPEARGLSEAERAALIAETLQVLNHPDFAPIFGPGSRAEAPIAGLIEGKDGPRPVSGQLDRILVGTEKVLVVDYKSNRPPPPNEAGVAPAYLRQMAAYRALLAQIYPGKTIDCALLWTDAPRLMQLSPERLDSHAP
ncbi:MAG: PD-(D/E)XK nuclease family protein, partial [Rhodovibrionaceae bacterium]